MIKIKLSMASEEGDRYQHSGSNRAAESVSDNSAPAHRGDIHYKILKKEDIKLFQENDISAVSGVLSVPRGVACSLLCLNNWCLTSAYENWFAAADDDGERNPNPTVNSTKQQICNICYENTLPKEMASAACGHPFCADCWETYIAAAVSAGAACLTLQCPEPGCGAAVTSDMVEKLASEADLGRYEEYLRRSYVESSRSRKWCPGAGCDRAVEFEVEIGSESYDVVCDCSHKFCWKCGEEWHRPVDCEAAAEWLKRNKSDAESTMWILDNTKPCPKCRRPIEKVDGDCNHMTCGAPCEFQCCWMCGAPWESHVDDSLKLCRSYTRKIIKEEWSRIGGEKRLIERYLHYYIRWDLNQKNWKEAVNDLEGARRKYEGQWRMQFVVEAWEQVVECQRVLKWSYVYGYCYLPSKEGWKTDLLEFLQRQAEMVLVSLRHCLQGLGYYREAEVLYWTSVTRKYFNNLVVALENDLPEVVIRLKKES